MTELSDWASGCTPIVWPDAPAPYEASRAPAWVPNTAVRIITPTQDIVVFAYAWVAETPTGPEAHVCMATLPFAGQEANHHQYARLDLEGEPMLDTINFGGAMEVDHTVQYAAPTETEPHRYV